MSPLGNSFEYEFYDEMPGLDDVTLRVLSQRLHPSYQGSDISIDEALENATSADYVQVIGDPPPQFTVTSGSSGDFNGTVYTHVNPIDEAAAEAVLDWDEGRARLVELSAAVLTAQTHVDYRAREFYMAQQRLDTSEQALNNAYDVLDDARADLSTFAASEWGKPW